MSYLYGVRGGVSQSKHIMAGTRVGYDQLWCMSMRGGGGLKDLDVIAKFGKRKSQSGVEIREDIQ